MPLTAGWAALEMYTAQAGARDQSEAAPAANRCESRTYSIVFFTCCNHKGGKLIVVGLIPGVPRVNPLEQQDEFYTLILLAVLKICAFLSNRMSVRGETCDRGQNDGISNLPTVVW